MKIVFLCGTLEQGDGVGDYTRRLAEALIGRSYQIAIVAINDAYVVDQRTNVIIIENKELHLMRLPNSWPSSQRIKIAVDWAREFGADWLSLQYVGFGFDQYGLPRELLSLKALLGNKVKLQIMFHELWCGMAATASYKERLLGAFQKGFLLLLLRKLSPDKVFTNTLHYAEQLQRLGTRPQVLPIFGNIPLGDYGSDEIWDELVSEQDFRSVLGQPDKWLVVGFFGTVYTNPGIRSLLQIVHQAAEQSERKLGIISLGKNRGAAVKSLTNDLANVSHWSTGSLSIEMLNRVMQIVNLGVMTTLAAGLNKSGSAVAWLERGVPLLVSPEDSTYVEAEMINLGVYQINAVSDVLRSIQERNDIVRQNRLEAAAQAYCFIE